MTPSTSCKRQSTVPVGNRKRVPLRRYATLLDRHPLLALARSERARWLVEGRTPCALARGVSVYHSRQRSGRDNHRPQRILDRRETAAPAADCAGASWRSALLIKKQGDYPPFWHKDVSFISVMEELYERVRTKNRQMK